MVTSNISQVSFSTSAKPCWLWLTGMLLVLSSSSISRAADFAWSVRNWRIDDGSNNSIVGVDQSPDGYLWIATMAGLNRFDGANFEHHVAGSFFNEPEANVRGILSSRSGGLWIVLDGAVIFLERDKKPVIVRDNIPSLKFEHMTEDSQGALWLGYHYNMICRVKDGKAVALGNDAGIPKALTSSLATDIKDQLWLAAGNQIGIIRDGHFTKMFEVPSGAALARANSGGLWICSGLSLYKYDESGSLKLLGTLPLPRQIRSKTTTPLTPFEDRGGTLWIGTTTDGLYRFDNSAFEKVVTPQVKITCFAEDHEGNLWAGTDAGVDRICPRAVEVEGSQGEIPHSSVAAICQATGGTIWAAMADGALMIRTGNEWAPAPFTFQGDADCVAADSQGAVWMGTDNRELYQWKSGQVRKWETSNGLAGHFITALLPTHSGDLWVAATAPDAIMRLHEGHLIAYKLPGAVHRIDAMAEDHDGNIWMGWVGTRIDTGGLLEISGDHIIDDRSLSGINKPVQTICVMDDNTVLFGCRVGELGWFKNGKFGAITTQQGLYDDNIGQIISDDRGWLWFGSSHGIFKIRQRDLKDFTDGKLNRLQPVQYGPDEGLPALQAIRGTSSALRTADGRIWMAMATALAIVHPDRIREQMPLPQVHIEHAMVDDKMVASATDYFADNKAIAGDQPGFVLKLPPDYHRLEFDFAALTFAAPENARFRYRLEGFDEDWMETSEPRQAIYPRLPAGNYRFRVVGSSADGNWSGQEADMAVTITPFVWQNWWFQVAAVGLFSIVLLLLVRYLSFRRLRRRLEIAERRGALDRERDRIARDIHDDLGHGLTQIVLLSELTLHDHMSSDEREDHLGQIVTTAKQGLRSLDETVWAINPRNDTLPDLVDYLGHFVMKSLGTAHIKCRLDLPDCPPNQGVPAEVRHSLFLVVKEAVNNIICHANATTVHMTITITNDALTMTIEDDGHGFAFGESSPGQDGLLNMRQRMSDIGGKFQIESEVGMGTRISLGYSWRSQARMPKMKVKN